MTQVKLSNISVDLDQIKKPENIEFSFFGGRKFKVLINNKAASVSFSTLLKAAAKDKDLQDKLQYTEVKALLTNLKELGYIDGTLEKTANIFTRLFTKLKHWLTKGSVEAALKKVLAPYEELKRDQTKIRNAFMESFGCHAKVHQWAEKATEKGDSLPSKVFKSLLTAGNEMQLIQDLEKEANEGDPFAECFIGWAYSKLPTRNEEENKEKSRKHLESSSKKGIGLATFFLTLLEEDPEMRVKLTKQASNQGCTLGLLSEIDFAENEEAIMKLVQEAEKKGLNAALLHTAQLYLRGNTAIKMDKTKALEMLNKIAESDDDILQFDAAMVLLNEKSFNDDFKNQFKPIILKLLEKSSTKGNLDAQCELGHLYLYGCPLNKNYVTLFNQNELNIDKGIELLKKAANHSRKAWNDESNKAFEAAGILKNYYKYKKYSHPPLGAEDSDLAFWEKKHNELALNRRYPLTR